MTATFVLIPGAGGDAWYWHRLVPELRKRGHETIAVELPTGDDSAGEWWAATGQPEAREAQAARDGRDRDLLDTFFHDVAPQVTNEAIARGEPDQSATPFGQPWPLDRWPDVSTRVLQGCDDRLFPVELQRRVAAERLGITPEEMPGGHLVALSRPAELADRLVAMLST